MAVSHSPAIAAGFAAGSLLICSCDRDERVSVLARYLVDERILRQNVVNAALIEDSLQALQVRYGIDPAHEIQRLHDNPHKWLELLKVLQHAE
ncbi:hypothetical protein IBX73_03520 [candidate division WOR-3 bacterium]|nr:hypothetical protein [candidate division WOR-3 bacterium]